MQKDSIARPSMVIVSARITGCATRVAPFKFFLSMFLIKCYPNSEHVAIARMTAFTSSFRAG